MFKLDTKNFDNTFFKFYPLFNAQFVQKSETISFSPCNIMIGQ